jgi:hypothetical protein
LVAAVLTALRGYKPELTPDEAEQLLTSTADARAAGKVINVAAAFRAAGLAAMVDAYQPPAPASPPSPAVINVGAVCPDGRVLCQKPTLAAARRKRDKITLTVESVPPGAFLQARVRRHWHNSTTNTVTLRVTHLRKIILSFGSIDGDRSPSLTVTPRDLRRYKDKRRHHQRL